MLYGIVWVVLTLCGALGRVNSYFPPLIEHRPKVVIFKSGDKVSNLKLSQARILIYGNQCAEIIAEISRPVDITSVKNS